MTDRKPDPLKSSKSQMSLKSAKDGKPDSLKSSRSHLSLNAAMREKTRRLKSQTRSWERLVRRSTADSVGDVEVIPGLARSRFLENIVLRVPVLVQRLELEVKMSVMMFRMPAFCLLSLSFIFALFLLYPTNETAQVNFRILDHFGLDDTTLDTVVDFPSLYNFIENFEIRNEQLQATSWKYWCEQRYFNLGLDAELGIPIRQCHSPRYHALSHISGDASSWKKVGAAPSPNPRKKPCVDDDAGLRLINPTYTTCAANASLVCPQDFSLRYCQLTCGFCPKWSYERWKPFPMVQITVLPSVVFQTRYTLKQCEGFASVYEGQTYNSQLPLLPALDGPRGGPILACVDRKSAFDEDYAHRVPCPSSTSSCPKGYIEYTKKLNYAGSSIYPKILLEPHLDIRKMEAIEWIDVQTSTVEVSTLIYTEPPFDMFTALSVRFTMDATGGIVSTRRVDSFKDLEGVRQTIFCICLVLATLLCIVGIYHAWKQLTSPAVPLRRSKWWNLVFEAACKTLMSTYFIALAIRAMQMPRMRSEFEKLIQRLEAVQLSSGTDAFQSVIQQFFDTLTVAFKHEKELVAHRVVSYIVCYMLFILLMLNFAAHPRVGVITFTISKAWDNLFHFSIVLWMSLSWLGMISYFFFGGQVELFTTFKNTFTTESKLLFGQWIQEVEDTTMNSDELTGITKLMYWTFIITFMLFIFFMLLNLLLAIIVNAFFEVKKDEEEDETEDNFFVDALDVFSTRAWYRYARWPDQGAMIQKLKWRLTRSKTVEGNVPGFDDVADGLADAEDEDSIARACPGDLFMTEFPGVMEDTDQLIAFLAYYYDKTPAILELSDDSMAQIPQEAANAHNPEAEVKKLRMKLAVARQNEEQMGVDFAKRLDQERQGIQSVWSRIAQERDEFTKFLAHAAVHGRLQPAASPSKDEQHHTRAIPIGLGLAREDDWKDAIQPRDSTGVPETVTQTKRAATSRKPAPDGRLTDRILM